jgi:tetratricopeptide (TPR) repeat protein
MAKNRYAEYFDKIYDEVRGVFEEEEDAETRLRMADDILREHPDNPFAMYIKWQEMDDDESREDQVILARAVGVLRPMIIEAASDGELRDEVRSVYVSLLSDLASLQYFSDDKDAALETAREFMRFDQDCFIIGRLVYYTLLIEKGLYIEAVSAADGDDCETPIAAYCRAIAIYEMEGSSVDASDALIEAISIDPDMAFYILGRWEIESETDDMDPEEEDAIDDLIMHASMLSDLWAAKEDRLSFFGVAAFAFGYMTGRMDGDDDIDMLEDGYKKIGCLDEIREARDTLRAMIASGKEQELVDQEALMMFRDIRDRWFFS